MSEGDQLDIETPTAWVTVTDDRLAKNLSVSEFNHKNRELAVKAGWSPASFQAGGHTRLIFRKHMDNLNKDAYYAAVPAKGRELPVGVSGRWVREGI